MVKQRASAVDGRGRTWSLRREWSRAFAIMLVLSLVVSVGTFVGVRQLVGQFSGTAQQLDREMTIAAALKSGIADHEVVAHQLVHGVSMDRAAYVRQQRDISRQFDVARRTFPSGNGTVATLAEANRLWQAALTKAGVWGDQVLTYVAPSDLAKSEDIQAALGVDSDAARALVDGLQKPSLDAMHKGLANDARLQRLLMGTLAVLFGLAIVSTLYFRRRMAKDLLRPVAGMHQGVLRLQAGDYDHRIRVIRRDELGELAQAFNSMAGALHDSHRALTLRATHDSLTGLANRASLTERLAASFRPGSDRRARHESVLFIDVDDFKDVNDSLGHDAGDALLIQLATRLTGCVRPHDLVARLGGDEFAVVVVEGVGECTAVDVAERVLAVLRTPFLVGGARLAVAVSIGVAQRRPETVDAAELLRHADFAMYMAKGGGKGRYQVFDAQMHDNVVGRATLKADLAAAAASGQLRLDYQPVADLRTGEVVGVEALLRWQHPTLGLLAPADFIRSAEETGDINAIGQWVLETATRQAAVWREMDHCAELWMSVNLSGYQLSHPESLTAIEDILTDPGARPNQIVLEIKETALAADIDGGTAALNRLRNLGVRIAIDDFGTGLSSLSTLAGLPVDILKIDCSFAASQASASSAPLMEGLLGLAAKLSLEVIAKGIEEPHQLELLRGLGCHRGQGFLLARPTSAEALDLLLAAGGLIHVTAVTAS
jgi:diguanylate cyclase (GGDEF)-like protein